MVLRRAAALTNCQSYGQAATRLIPTLSENYYPPSQSMRQLQQCHMRSHWATLGSEITNVFESSSGQLKGRDCHRLGLKMAALSTSVGPLGSSGHAPVHGCTDRSSSARRLTESEWSRMKAL